MGSPGGWYGHRYSGRGGRRGALLCIRLVRRPRRWCPRRQRRRRLVNRAFARGVHLRACFSSWCLVCTVPSAPRFATRLPNKTRPQSKKLRRSPVRAPSMTAPSHCHAVLCRDAAVRCHLPLSDGLPVMRAGACAQSARSAISSAIRQAWTDAHDKQVTVQPGILAQCELISLCTTFSSKSWPHPVHRSHAWPRRPSAGCHRAVGRF